MKWAFSDESRRPGQMVVGVVILETHEVEEARRALRQLLLPGQRRLHLTDERPGRRSQILSTVLELPMHGFAVVASTSGRRVVEVRRRLLIETVGQLLEAGVERWTLDGVERIQRDRDRSDIGNRLRATDTHLLYDHEPSAAEPLLWAADALTWAMGAGGEHARRCASRFATVELEP